jgi:hypothetical protein
VCVGVGACVLRGCVGAWCEGACVCNLYGHRMDGLDGDGVCASMCVLCCAVNSALCKTCIGQGRGNLGSKAGSWMVLVSFSSAPHQSWEAWLC